MNFDYAVATPHRLCICVPESSNKTLLDVYEEGIDMYWSDGNTMSNPLGAYRQLHNDFKVTFRFECETGSMRCVSWKRIEGWIPALYTLLVKDDILLQVSIVSTVKGDIIKLHAINNGKECNTIRIYAFVCANVVNMKWYDFDYPYSVSTPIWGDRGDRMILLSAEKDPVIPRNREYVDTEIKLNAGDTVCKYMYRPYYALLDDIEEYIDKDYSSELEKGLEAWRSLISRASVFKLPDKSYEDAYRACLADIFVMRERQADGNIAGLAGTEMYRAANTGEPCFQALTLSRYGFFKEAKDNIDFVSGFQDEDGCWEDSKQWGRFIWSASGWKSLAVKRYYLFTKDRCMLEESFKRMLKSSRWSKKQREKTKLKNDRSSPEWGLMPRGMGDCGLIVNDDLFGVFYPHNFNHYVGLCVCLWAAKELKRDDVTKELEENVKDYRECILASLEKGCIHDSSGRVWIPGSPNCETGSRYGMADCIFPAMLIDKHSKLANGTMDKLQENLSEGGLPKDLGWLKGGLWVAIAIDTIAYADIIRGDADIAAGFYEAALDHATPLFTWCEERLGEKGSTVKTGDMEHAWTPICVARYTRDMLVMEDEYDQPLLYLLRGIPRSFVSDGAVIEVHNAPTHFGTISYTVKRVGSLITVELDVECECVLCLRLPEWGNEEKKYLLKKGINEIRGVI